MKPQKGTVVGIDRATRTVRFRLAEDPDEPVAGPPLEAAYMGAPPWPLATALFINSPAWICLGPVGFERPIFHDDFCGDTTPFGDTDWVASGTGSISYRQDPGDGQAGAIDINGTTGSTSYRIRKHLRAVPFGNDAVLWMTARVALDAQLLAVNEAVIGFGTTNLISPAARGASDCGVYAYFTWDPAGATFGLISEAGTSSSNLSTGEGIVADQYYWIDIMVVGGSWAALWVDGSGPWLLETNIPSTAHDATSPYASIHMNSSVAAAFRLDLFRASLVSAVAAPQAYAASPATAYSWP